MRPANNMLGGRMQQAVVPAKRARPLVRPAFYHRGSQAESRGRVVGGRRGVSREGKGLI